MAVGGRKNGRQDRRHCGGGWGGSKGGWDVRKHWEWKAGVRVGVDAEMESESWVGWGGARGRCGNVRQGGDGECGRELWSRK